MTRFFGHDISSGGKYLKKILVELVLIPTYYSNTVGLANYVRDLYFYRERVHRPAPAPTRHFVELSGVWFLIVNKLLCEAYLMLAPKCRVGAGG